MDFDLDQSKVSPGNQAANMAMLNRGTVEIVVLLKSNA